MFPVSGGKRRHTKRQQKPRKIWGEATCFKKETKAREGGQGAKKGRIADEN